MIPVIWLFRSSYQDSNQCGKVCTCTLPKPTMHNVLLIFTASVIILLCITSTSIQHLLGSWCLDFCGQGIEGIKSPVFITQQNTCGTSKIVKQHGYNSATVKIKCNHKTSVYHKIQQKIPRVIVFLLEIMTHSFFL